MIEWLNDWMIEWLNTHREKEAVYLLTFFFLSFSRAITRVPLYPGFLFHSSLPSISARIHSIPTTSLPLREFFSECCRRGSEWRQGRRERAGRVMWTMGHSELIHLRFCRLPVKLPSHLLVLRTWLTCLEERIRTYCLEFKWGLFTDWLFVKTNKLF